MLGTIGPNVAAAAVALRRSHPTASAKEVLDVCLRRRHGCVADFGAAVMPPAPFAMLIAEAFDRQLSLDEWRRYAGRRADPIMRETAHSVWAQSVLPQFAAAYGLSC